MGSRIGCRGSTRLEGTESRALASLAILPLGCRGSTRLEGTESVHTPYARGATRWVAEVRPGLRVLKGSCKSIARGALLVAEVRPGLRVLKVVPEFNAIERISWLQRFD